VSIKCLFQNVTLLLLTGMLFVLGVQDSRYITNNLLYGTTDFSNSRDKWLERGDLQYYKWTESYVQVSQKNIQNKREAFIFRKIQLPVVVSNSAFDESNIGKNIGLDIQQNSRLLRVRGEILVKQASQSKLLDHSRRAGYMVWFYDSEGDVSKYITVKSFKAQSESPHFPDRTVILPNEVDSIALVFMLRDSDAVYQINSLQASFVEESKKFKYISYALWVSYCLLLICIIWFAVGYKGLIVSAGLTVLVALLIVGIIVPDSLRLELIRPLYESILDHDRWSIWGLDISALIFKVGHVVAFAALSIYLFIFSHNKKYSIMCLACTLFIFAISTEVIQLYRYDREAKIVDIFFDMTGVAIGYMIYASFKYMTLRNSENA